MLKPGDIFEDKYEVVRLIGEGGFSFVYEANQMKLDRRVALKTLHLDKLKRDDPKGHKVERVLARFEREARAISRLKAPSTVVLHDFGVAGHNPFMVLEYIDGEELGMLLVREGAMRPERAIDLLIQLLESLEEAHTQDLLHRDIKPGNILVFDYLSKHERVKLLDFGLAKIFRDEESEGKNVTKDGQLLGTPRYMSPEQILKPEDLTPASDIYSLGLVAMEMLTGQQTVKGDDTMSLLGEQVSTASFKLPLGLRIIPELRELVERMVDKNLSKRFQTAAEVLDAVHDLPDVLSLPDLPPADLDSGDYAYSVFGDEDDPLMLDLDDIEEFDDSEDDRLVAAGSIDDELAAIKPDYNRAAIGAVALLVMMFIVFAVAFSGPGEDAKDASAGTASVTDDTLPERAEDTPPRAAPDTKGSKTPGDASQDAAKDAETPEPADEAPSPKEKTEPKAPEDKPRKQTRPGKKVRKPKKDKPPKLKIFGVE